MAITRGQATTITVQLQNATSPVTGTVDGTVLTNAPTLIAGTIDSYEIDLTEAETDTSSMYLLLTDSASEEYGITVVTEELEEIMNVLAQIQFLSPGPGWGDILHEDVITGAGGTAVKGAIVRAYPHDPSGPTTDFSTLSGSYTTEDDGSYHLYLNEGSYSRRVWKNGIVVLDDIITISGV